jgi:6-phosphogluconolactonase
MIPRAAAFLIALAASLSAVPVFIGTNTGGDTGSKGIYLADFNLETGVLSAPQLAAEYQNPGFLALHPTKPVLLAVGTPNKPFADGTDAVAAFAIAPDHSLKFLGEATTGGKGACHLAVDPAGRTVAVANYGDGSISTVRLDDNGVPEKTVSVITNQGAGPNKSRQNGPHAHGVYFDKAGTRLFVPDLGLDRVWVYPFDPATSQLGAPLPPLATAPGAGPRHMAFSADGKNAYVINELDNTVLTAAFDEGALKPLGTAPTLPQTFTGTNTTAEVEVSHDDRFVYASNRGHDTIAVFWRNEQSGALTFRQHAPCGGKTPRHFKIAPGGKWLLCAHMESHTISVLPIDLEAGTLSTPSCTVPSPSPICILFGH